MATAEITPKYPDIFDTTTIKPKDRFDGPLHAIDDPVTVCFGVAANELMRRPFEFKTQEIKDILWSFSKVRLYHFAWMLPDRLFMVFFSIKLVGTKCYRPVIRRLA